MFHIPGEKPISGGDCHRDTGSAKKKWCASLQFMMFLQLTEFEPQNLCHFLGGQQLNSLFWTMVVISQLIQQIFGVTLWSGRPPGTCHRIFSITQSGSPVIGECFGNWLVVWNMAFIFPNTWDDPIWLIFFRVVETTNQEMSMSWLMWLAELFNGFDDWNIKVKARHAFFETSPVNHRKPIHWIETPHSVPSFQLFSFQQRAAKSRTMTNYVYYDIVNDYVCEYVTMFVVYICLLYKLRLKISKILRMTLITH